MGSKIEKCLGFFDKISAFEETVLKIGIGSLKSYFVLQISIVCKIEPFFKDIYDMQERSYLLTHLLSLLKNLKILFLKQNNPFEETQF